MKILALSTSTARGSAAVLDDGEARATIAYADLKGHAERIFGALDGALAEARLGRGDDVVDRDRELGDLRAELAERLAAPHREEVAVAPQRTLRRRRVLCDGGGCRLLVRLDGIVDARSRRGERGLGARLGPHVGSVAADSRDLVVAE